MQTFRFHDLIITVSRDSEGYEMLVEADTDAEETSIWLNIGTASGDVAVVEL